MNLSISYHPQTDGQSERTIGTLKDMLRSCIIKYSGCWDTHLPFLWSLLTITLIIPILTGHHVRHFIRGGLVLLHIGLSLVRNNLDTQILFC